VSIPVADGRALAGMGDLRALGFEGFLSVAQLRDEGAESVPVDAGVWVVVREGSPALPHFQPRSSAAAWRGQDPTLTADELAGRWVPQAYVLYVGLAPGTGVRHLLQQRIKRFLRFGSGRNVAHWSGRRIWQLSGTASLRIAWRATGPDAARGAAQEVLDAFSERHGSLPYANDMGEEEA
jgi:hypothetical protein